MLPAVPLWVAANIAAEGNRRSAGSEQRSAQKNVGKKEKISKQYILSELVPQEGRCWGTVLRRKGLEVKVGGKTVLCLVTRW